ncbi:MAG: hypothetical protein K6G07_07475 [Lachnospiraceae bacterium]|nr:hypothetical protein [Lachnospiraceae bacterium]
MKKVLGFASTPYQLLVLLFIKDWRLSEDEVDLIITDKTPSMQELCQNAKLKEIFGQVIFGDGRKIDNPYKKAPQVFYESFIKNKTTDVILDGKLQAYDEVYFASPGNPDEIIKEVAKTVIKLNRKVRFTRFEDGFASYTKPFSHVISTAMGAKAYRLLWNYDIEEKESEMLMFAPSMAEPRVSAGVAEGTAENSGVEHPSFVKLTEIEVTKERIEKIVAQANDIFGLVPKPPKEDVIFLGQGTVNGMNNAGTYQNLIRRLAKLAEGNFVIKPHPRGEHDDFGEEFPVYRDTCPFELAIAGGGFEDKTLISFYSTACVSGKLLFHSKCRIIFLYPLCEDAFNEKCDYEHYFSAFEERCENVFIARTWEELEELLRS